MFENLLQCNYSSMYIVHGIELKLPSSPKYVRKMTIFYLSICENNDTQKHLKNVKL